MPRIETHHAEPACAQFVDKPGRHRAGFNANAGVISSVPPHMSMAARNSPESSGGNSPLHSDLVTAESPRRGDIGEAIEVGVDAFLKSLGGGAVAEAFGEGV